MSRVLSFGDDAVGQVYVRNGSDMDNHEAKGDIEVPAGAEAYLLLADGAPGDLPFLVGLDRDVVVMVQAAAISPEGMALLAEQEGLKQLAIKAPLDDAGIGMLAAHPTLGQLDVTLSGAGGPGLATLADGPLQALTLHGDPGEALPDLARSSLSRLHIHLPFLSAGPLTALAASTHLESLDLEVAEVLSDEEVGAVRLLADVGTGLRDLGVTTEDGSDGLGPAARIAVLEANPELTLNGVTYTAAAVERLRRRAGSS